MGWPAVVGAAVSTIGSLIGNSQQNSANANLNKENRAFQWAQMLRQQQWSEDMWNKENEYNTPLSQRERLKEAGYNPWISGSGGMSNVSQQHSSPGGSSAPSPIPMQNVLGPAIANGVNTYLSASATKANVANQNADTMIKASQGYSDMLKAGVDKDVAYKIFANVVKSAGGSDKLIGDLSSSINQDFLSARIKNDRDSLEYFIRHEFGRSEAETQLNLLKKNVDLVDEKIASLKKQQNVSDAQVANLAQSTAKMLAETNTISQSMEFIVKKLQYEADILENDPMRSGLFASASKSGPVLQFIVQLLKLLK